jgi:ubiquinol-cytochrome c reductase subunit 9
MGGLMHSVYRTLMTRNSVYVTFVICGALAGERVVNAGVDVAWKSHNKGKLYDDLVGTVIGGPKPDDD